MGQRPRDADRIAAVTAATMWSYCGSFWMKSSDCRQMGQRVTAPSMREARVVERRHS